MSSAPEEDNQKLKLWPWPDGAGGWHVAVEQPAAKKAKKESQATEQESGTHIRT